VPLAILPKYIVPSRLDVRFSGVTAVSLMVTWVRPCARATGANDVNATTATISSRMVRGAYRMKILLKST